MLPQLVSENVSGGNGRLTSRGVSSPAASLAYPRASNVGGDKQDSEEVYDFRAFVLGY